VSTGRGAGAQFGLAARARAAVLATADEIRAEDVPPAPALAPAESPRPGALAASARAVFAKAVLAKAVFAKAVFAKAGRRARG
jgi:hypothetical protein